MDCDDDDNSRFVTARGDDESRSAVNSLILDYYKKFGRKRDLEQYFSLSTAQNDLRDPTGTFWRKMKSENDSSDSGDKKSESSQELCRISIRCAALPDPSTSQEEDSKTKSESVSPPIITEEITNESQHNSDAESQKSEDNHSQKSYDVLLDTSLNKPFSPTSSITSQRKLEWDSLADVGYANESDRKTSASSLSTLERLALMQQYSNNDHQSPNIGPPTSQSTPIDENETKSKIKKGIGKKSTKIYKKDIDLVELNVPQSSDNPTQSINVNLTKHISFNVEKDGKVTVENVQKNISVSPDKVTKVDEPLKALTDKEIQTSLHRTKDAAVTPEKDTLTAPNDLKPIENTAIKIPVMISLNTLRKKTRRKRLRMARRKLKAKKQSKKNVQEKSTEQLSEAESFEYMPGHIYNQNQLQSIAKEERQEQPSNVAGNKSSLESSGVLTTDSSKGSAHSFTKDLEKGIELLRNSLQDRCDDTNLRKQLIKQICARLIKSKYRDDDSTSDFLSGFTFRNKRVIERNVTTTSTSDANDSGEKLNKPKKSILRNDKFNAAVLASSSQSAPNLPVATNSENPVSSKLAKQLLTSNTDSEQSSKEKTSSDNIFTKASSEELYQKYLAALRREQAYKRHLKDKETFLKQKLVSSDSAFNVTTRDSKINSRLQDLIKDLTRNNYDDGSGDASKLEGGPNSYTNFDRFIPITTQRSHSVFTLSSGNSDYQNKKSNLKKRLQCNLKDVSKPSTSKDHYCCCPHHSNNRLEVADSSVQVNIKIPSEGDSRNERPISRETSPRRTNNSPRKKSPKHSPRRNSPKSSPRKKSKDSPRKDTSPRNTKIVCVCSAQASRDVNEFLIHKPLKPGKSDNCSEKCSLHSNASCSSKNRILGTTSEDCCYNNSEEKLDLDRGMKKSSKSSQTNLLLKMLCRKSSDRSIPCSCSDNRNYAQGDKCSNIGVKTSPTYTKIFEATRCIQTEISINPKISDPTLSDVNIVNDSSCAKLICEGVRETPKPSVTEIYSCDLVNPGTFTGSTKSSGTSKDIEDIKDQLADICELDSERNYRANEIDRCISNTAIEKIDDFAIPIQGTNMTLLVSINPNERKNNQIVVTENANVNTEIVQKNEQGTSLIEECSKGVQCENVALDLNSNNLTKKSTIDKHVTTYETNPCITGTSKFFNTYPKSPVNERKPLVRTNTDTNNLERTYGQIDVTRKSNPSSIKSLNSLEHKATTSCTQTPRDNGLQSMKSAASNCVTILDDAKKCACGCEQKDCNNKCMQSNFNVVDSCKTPSANVPSSYGFDHKDDGTNDKRKNSKPEHCSCGCDHKNCNNQCLRGSNSKNDCVKLNKEKCDCGCSKNKCDCDKKCSEKQSDISNISCNRRPQEPSCKKEIGIQKDFNSTQSPRGDQVVFSISKVTNLKNTESNKNITDSEDKIQKPTRTNENVVHSGSDTDQYTSDPILDMIQNITKRYSKKDIEKNKRKKCFKEIMNVLKYLVETEDSTDCNEGSNHGESSTPQNSDTGVKKSQESVVSAKKPKESEQSTSRGQKSMPSKKSDEPAPCGQTKSKTLVDKGIQLPSKSTKIRQCLESSDICSTDLPGTSSDSAACKVLNKIKKECEKYHQKRCKCYGKKFESSSTSVNCDLCRKVHQCNCRYHKCKSKKCTQQSKKPVAYNLIIQTSDSLMSEDGPCESRQLKNIVVKVPKQKLCEKVPFKELEAKIESRMNQNRNEPKCCRTRSLPNESDLTSLEEILRKRACSMREYLERNRPDFVENCTQRQNCLKIVNGARANERAIKRDLLLLRLAELSDVKEINSDEIQELAKELGKHLRQSKPHQKFISEREMKKHSEKIYKSLPEVVRKKEEAKKSREKKTNLLMADIFKRNLQKKTLRGYVNLSNYSSVIQI